MAPVPATIDLSWVSNYAGPHRVCYRIQGSGDPYTCTTSGTHPNCPGSGSPCGYSIAITVDDETCDAITYEGYIQAACEDEESEAGRIPFLVTFTPDPSCKKWDVNCDNAPVASIALTDGGSGYNPAGAPSVAIAGGGGAGATASATVGQGVIQSLAINDGGSGYNDGAYVGVDVTGGSGVGATADVTVAGGVITVVTINVGGTGYQDTDLLGLDAADLGGSTPTTTVELSPTTDYGIITGLSLDTPGSGYTSTPAVVIDAPPGEGSTATGTVTLEDCPGFPARECDTITGEDHQPVPVGDTVSICYTTDPSASFDSQYAVSENGNCLCDCRDVDIENTGGAPIDVVYYDCTNQQVATVTLNEGGGATNICMAADSLTYDDSGGGTFSITDNGACDGDGI